MATLQATTIAGTLAVTGSITGSGTGLASTPGTAFVNGAVTNEKIANNTIGRTKIGYAGAVLQTRLIRFDPRPGWSAPTNNGNRVTSMRLDITPTYANSLIICEWRIHGESASHDAGFRVFRNGARVEGANGGYNLEVNNSHSFINSEFYDADDSSTPNLCAFLYYDFPNTTAALFYEPAIGSSDGNTRTFFQNRPISSGGQNNHENGVSFARITEIRQ